MIIFLNFTACTLVKSMCILHPYAYILKKVLVFIEVYGKRLAGALVALENENCRVETVGKMSP